LFKKYNFQVYSIGVPKTGIGQQNQQFTLLNTYGKKLLFLNSGFLDDDDDDDDETL
jgi:hypothetical protein